MNELSKDFNVSDASGLIREMVSVEQVQEFIAGDDRKGVNAAAEDRLEELAAQDNGNDPEATEKPEPDPRMDETMRRIDSANYHTINVLADPHEPEYQSVNASGTRKDGTEMEIRLKVRRGEDVQNVPKAAVAVLYLAVATKHREVKKSGDQGGKRLVPYKEARFPMQIKDSYDTLKAE